MPTVRKRRSRKNSRINNTRYGRRLKKRSCKSVKNRIQLECIRERWDSKKTMKQNLMELGLSIDPNRSLPVRQPNNSTNEVDDMAVENTELQKSTPSEQTDLISELEAIAANAPPN
ncbi:Nucleolar protein 16, partial [Geodia barretti]